MEWQQLAHFRAVARTQHLGRASAELGVSQPALSRTIARLEAEFGVSLFDRRGRSIQLNRFGRVLLVRVERALQELEDARSELTDLSESERTAVVLGFLAPCGRWLIPELLRAFKAKCGLFKFRLMQAPGPVLQQHLIRGEVDLCLIASQIQDPAAEWIPLCDEELFALVPPGHQIAGQRQIALRALKNEPFVALKPGCGLRRISDALCARAGFRPRITFESEEVGTMWSLIGSGLGVGIGPRPAVAGPTPPASVSISDPPCWRTIGLAWMKGRYHSAACRKFVEFVRTRYPRKCSLSPRAPQPQTAPARISRPRSTS